MAAIWSLGSNTKEKWLVDIRTRTRDPRFACPNAIHCTTASNCLLILGEWFQSIVSLATLGTQFTLTVACFDTKFTLIVQDSNYFVLVLTFTLSLSTTAVGLETEGLLVVGCNSFNLSLCVTFSKSGTILVVILCIISDFNTCFFLCRDHITSAYSSFGLIIFFSSYIFLGSEKPFVYLF